MQNHDYVSIVIFMVKKWVNKVHWGGEPEDGRSDLKNYEKYADAG